jgi:hypothetical protein
MSAPAGNLLLDDTTWDLVLERGNLVISSGYDATRQACYQRLRFFAGEWWADENVGLPYWQRILGKKQPDTAAIREVFRAAILASPGIASVTSINLRWTDTREMTLDFVAVMDSGALLVTDGFAIGAP